MKQCILYVCHIFNDESIKRFNFIKNGTNNAVFWAYDKADKQDDYIFNFDKEELEKKYGRFFYWGETQLPQVNFICMDFMDKHPEYDYVWCIEYDLIMIGNNWKPFFDNFSKSGSDLIASCIVDYDDELWYPISVKRKWDCSYKTYFKPMLQSLNTIFRISRKMCDAMEDFYTPSKEIFYELGMPSVCLNYGLTLEDISGRGRYTKDENRGRFYVEFSSKYTCSNGNIIFSQKTYEIYSKVYQGKLMHAVKLNVNI